MIVALIIAIWILCLALAVALCAAARGGDLQATDAAPAPSLVSVPRWRDPERVEATIRAEPGVVVAVVARAGQQPAPGPEEAHAPPATVDLVLQSG